MSTIRRLDHIAIATASTEDALASFVRPLGLAVVHQEVVEEVGVRLTYADAGNAMVQIVEPLPGAKTPLAEWVAATGGGLHHVCFSTDDVGAAADRFRSEPGDIRMGRGRGRPSAFAPGLRANVRLEFTGFDLNADVDQTTGYLGRPTTSDR